MNRAFCTYFDHRYLSRGLTMFRSLKDQCPAARLWVLCLSDECHRVLTRLDWPDLVLIRLEDFENGDAPLQAAKRNRSAIEYYFTCTPSLPLYVFKHNPDLDMVTYVDADLYFFSSPEAIFEEIGSKSIAITPHRFAPQHKWMEQNGIFNVAWLTFRRDEQGLSCLHWWRERCLEWCYDYIDGDRFADQKYLDQFPRRFSSLCIIGNKGVNLAAWNLANYRLHERNGSLWVDDQPVVFYHFHGLKKVAPGLVDPALAFYGLRLSRLMEAKLFRFYLKKLRGVRVLAALPPASALRRQQSAADSTRVSSGRIRAVAKLLKSYYGVLRRQLFFSRGE